MLHEVTNPRQNENERRRVFSDEYFDLYIWLDDDDSVSGFQLCYGKNSGERALTWKRSSGYTHLKVDDGEDTDGGYKRKPMLITDGLFDCNAVSAKFKKASAGLPREYRDLVLGRIKDYPATEFDANE